MDVTITYSPSVWVSYDVVLWPWNQRTNALFVQWIMKLKQSRTPFVIHLCDGGKVQAHILDSGKFVQGSL